MWDLLGKIRREPVYKMIGGKTREKLKVYATGPAPDVYRELGFFGTKVPLPHGPGDGLAGSSGPIGNSSPRPGARRVPINC